MNKRVLPMLIAATALFASSCKDARAPIPEPIDTNTIVDSSYRVGGIVDVSLWKRESVSYDISIAALSADPKSVTFSVEGLPSDVTASFTPPTGTAPFSTTLKVTANNANYGIYPITIVAKPNEWAAQRFPIVLTVTGKNAEDCNDYFYKGVGVAGGSIITEDSAGTVVKNETTLTQNSSNQALMLNDVYLEYHNIAPFSSAKSGDGIVIDVNCDDGTISIPTQQKSGTNIGNQTKTFTITGSGLLDYENKTFYINYTSNGVPYVLRGTVVL